MSASDFKAIVTGASALPGPPTAWAVVTEWAGKRPEFDLQVWSTAVGGAVLADAYLAGAVAKAAVIADDDIDSVTAGTDTINIASHALATGDGPIQFTTAGALPGGLALLTDYYVIVTGSGTFKVATTLANAVAATPVVVDITGAGTGTSTLVDTASTMRLHWLLSDEPLGPLRDGAIVLGTQLGWSGRLEHDPAVIAYGLIGTVSSGSGVCAAVRLRNPT